MDLIHEDSNHAMLGAIDRYELDLAFGRDENDFECTMAISDHCCSIGDYYLQCYITASKKTDYLIRKGYMRISLEISTDRTYWVRE